MLTVAAQREWLARSSRQQTPTRALGPRMPVQPRLQMHGKRMPPPGRCLDSRLEHRGRGGV